MYTAVKPYYVLFKAFGQPRMIYSWYLYKDLDLKVFGRSELYIYIMS